MGRSNLDGISRGTDRHDGNATPENEPTDRELGNRARRTRDDGPDDDDPAPAEHGDAATPAVRDGGGERGGEDGAHAVEGGDDGDWRPGHAGAEGVLEGLHRDDAAHQGAVIAVGSGAAEGDEDGEVHLEGTLAPSFDLGLRDGCVVFGLLSGVEGYQSSSSLGQQYEIIVDVGGESVVRNSHCRPPSL